MTRKRLAFARLEPVERVSIAMSAGAIAVSYAVAPPQFTAGLAAGAALEALNLRGLVGHARFLFGGETGGAGPWVGAFSARFGILALGIFLVIRAGWSPLGLLAGLSLAVPAVVLAAWTHRPRPLDHEVLPPTPADDPSWDRFSVWSAGAPEPFDPSEAQACPEDEA